MHVALFCVYVSMARMDIIAACSSKAASLKSGWVCILPSLASFYLSAARSQVVFCRRRTFFEGLASFMCELGVRACVYIWSEKNHFCSIWLEQDESKSAGHGAAKVVYDIQPQTPTELPVDHRSGATRMLGEGVARQQIPSAMWGEFSVSHLNPNNVS